MRLVAFTVTGIVIVLLAIILVRMLAWRGATVSYGVDSPQQTMDIYAPNANATGTCILILHGGGFISGDRKRWSGVARYFRDQGFACANADYRLAPQWHFPNQVEDARLMISYLRKHAALYNFRSDRIMVVGCSSGAYLALMLASLRSNDRLGLTVDEPSTDTRPVAIALECPVTTAHGMSKYEWFQDFIGCSERTAPDLYKQACPLSHLSGNLPPTFIIQGTADQTIPVGRVERFYRYLRMKGQNASLIELRGVGHGFGAGTDTPAQRETNSAILSFFTSALPDSAKTSGFKIPRRFPAITWR